MRRAAKVDANQPEILKALDNLGIVYQCLHTVGDGCPDILVCDKNGFNYLFEIKDPNGEPRERRLNDRQIKWFARWTGHRKKVFTVDEILKEIGAI